MAKFNKLQARQARLAELLLLTQNPPQDPFYISQGLKRALCDLFKQTSLDNALVVQPQPFHHTLLAKVYSKEGTTFIEFDKNGQATLTYEPKSTTFL